MSTAASASPVLPMPARPFTTATPPPPAAAAPSGAEPLRGELRLPVEQAGRRAAHPRNDARRRRERSGSAGDASVRGRRHARPMASITEPDLAGRKEVAVLSVEIMA